jgi:hypothetical protein
MGVAANMGIKLVCRVCLVRAGGVVVTTSGDASGVSMTFVLALVGEGVQLVHKTARSFTTGAR